MKLSKLVCQVTTKYIKNDFYRKHTKYNFKKTYQDK